MSAPVRVRKHVSDFARALRHEALIYCRAPRNSAFPTCPPPTSARIHRPRAAPAGAALWRVHAEVRAASVPISSTPANSAPAARSPCWAVATRRRSRTAGVEYDMLFGPAYKGIPLAVATAVAISNDSGRDVPCAFNRKEAKTHGEGGTLIGAPLAGRVLIIDDVITAGTAVRERGRPDRRRRRRASPASCSASTAPRAASGADSAVAGAGARARRSGLQHRAAGRHRAISRAGRLTCASTCRAMLEYRRQWGAAGG